jgi:hypothetical protein
VVVGVVGLAVTGSAAADFEKDVRPLLKQRCLDCHSTAKHKGDLDLERFKSRADALKAPKVWQQLVEQVSLGEMPPKDKPQPTTAQRALLLGWAESALKDIARTRAGDPGPVVLRRLSNAEYTYTLRDLTGVASLDPAREFPADSAAGEGFMNVGNALVMSPSLLTKYLDAAKDVAAHAVLLPDGIAFSPSTSQRDWSEERLAAIRAFYARYSVPGGGSAVNLQGIRFDTKDGGVLPLEKYFTATLELRGRASEVSALDQAAARHHLNAKYLATLWSALNATNASLLLDPLRAQWRTANPGDAPALARSVALWQQALWRFTQVGHIGKRNGPKAWQVPVVPIAESREVLLKLPPAAGTNDAVLYLTTSDAGDGNANDFALWENPRLVAPGRADLPLKDVRETVATLAARRAQCFAATENCLAAASELTNSPDAAALEALARKHNVPADALVAWLNCVGIGVGAARIESLITGRMERAQGYDFIKGWTGAEALSVIANSSDTHVRVPGNMKPHGVAVHPTPKLRVLVGWRSPVSTTLRASGVVQHAHPECGNGVTWAVELRRGNTRQRLAAGTAQGSREVKFGPLENLAVRPGDLIVVSIGPRDGNHACDLTAVDLTLTDGARTWDLAKDVSPDILAGNPHADRLGNAGVWHFFSEPDRPAGAEPVLPAGSLLAKWQSASTSDEKRPFAERLQKLLLEGPAQLATDSPDAALHRQLTAFNGPLLSPALRGSRPGEATRPIRNPQSAIRNPHDFGLDPALFGRHPNGAAVEERSLCVRAPSVLAVRLPADFADGVEFVATARLHAATASEGSVQMQALTNKPSTLGLAAGPAKELGGRSTWTDGERPVAFDSPILVATGSVARQRIESAYDEFRQLFPAALCYTKIVPVDEVVTLTLFYREDDQLRRLMLDDAQAAELDRLWAGLHYASHDALKLVDAFEQLWQYATQDADPSAFEPLRQPIKQRAEEFKKLLASTQPAHLDAVLKFAEGAYRRPLTPAESDELRKLYAKLRAEGLPHDNAIRLTLARTLVAPAFLYRTEKPGPGAKASPVGDWELATRLSYFLWSSAPDAELRAVAASGKLREPDVLAAQARRMLREPRTRRLATQFACAWLHVYDFDQLGEKSERHFPEFARLRGAMHEETIRFFTDLFQRDGSVLEILDADHTFLNADLAKHYGIPFEVRVAKGEGRSATGLLPRSSHLAPLTSDGWHRVDGMKQFGRGGILGHATTLAKQSGASRTSPILRGNWVAEVLLGEKLPRPPKDVPQLPEDEAAETLTVRQLTERHSSDPKCAGCHRRMDPYGYALEAFDAIGRRREKDLGGRAIDTRTTVMDGADINGLDGLRRYLLTTRRGAFVRQFSRKLLGYALGRGVLLSDEPFLDELTNQLQRGDYKVGLAVEAIVRSRQFREIRGREFAGEE